MKTISNLKKQTLKLQLKTFNFIKNNIFVIILFVLFCFLFFYRLDWNTLTSWDEAWYGSIAREIVRSGDILHLKWNGNSFYDHPPMGFWLMAASYKIFGINEFSTRFPSAILGLLSIIFLYKIGKELFDKKIIGFSAALVLGTSAWYLIRVRSGNLDAIFVFFYIMTVYTSIKSSKDFRWFPLVGLFFGGLILSKTLVGISALVLIIFLNLKQFFRVRHIIYLIMGVAVFYFVVAPWYKAQMKEWSYFFQYHFLNIGMRMADIKDTSHFKLSWQLPLFYLHMGVRKWYYIWLLSLGFLTLTFKWLKKNIFLLFLWNGIILLPFLFSEKTEIWHLIPTYIPLSLIIAVGVYQGIFFIPFILNKIRFILYLIFFLVIAFIQIKNFKLEVYPTSRYIPDDVDISRRAAKYKQSLYLDDDFLPIAVFYSGKNVTMLSRITEEKKTLVEFYQKERKNIVVITRNWVLDNLKKAQIPYKILEKNNSFSIITQP